jgi:hypothetical protein
MLVRGVSMLFGFAIAAAASGAGSAYAQPVDCGCLVAAGTAGIIRSVHGNVFVSQASGSVPAQPKMSLHVGNTVLVGPQSTSTVRFGENCTLRLHANTVFEVRPHDGKLCLAVNEQAPGVADGGTMAAAGGGGGGSFVVPGLLLGGLAAGGIAIAVSDSDNSVSK